MKFVFLLFFSIPLFSQTKPLELKIDTIKTSTDDDNDRQFVLYYHITNLSDKPVCFELNTNSIIPISGGSLRPYPYYKIYENDKSFDATGIFIGEKSKRVFKSQNEAQNYNDSIINAFKNRTLEQLILKKKEDFLNNIHTLKPKETMNINAVLIWNKKRYFKNDELEYYIEEKEPYFFELHINLMKEELLRDFSEEEKKEILNGKDLIKGWYTSNKVPIDFSE